jgi:TIR domain
MGVAEESKGRLKQILDEILLPSQATRGAPVEIFISYSHLDADLAALLDTHLAALRREGLVATWFDRQIGPGDQWREVIDDRLDRAAVVLILISANFIASDYCWDVELRRAMERHAAGRTRVIPVILRDCDWQHLPFGAFQAVPTGSRPVTSWQDPHEAIADVVRGVRAAVLDIYRAA